MANSSFFQKTNNVLPSFVPYYQWAGWGDKQGAASVNNIFLDLNADGFNDIIMHFQSGQNPETFATVQVGPSPNRLVVFLSDGNGGFVDGDQLVFSSQNPISLEGSSRKVVAGDLNDDGYPDVLYAVNREDGRSGQPAETNAAFASVLLSQANGKYTHINVGVENWYHSAGIVNGDSGPEIWLGGYFQSSGTIFRDATTQVASGFGYSLDNATGTFSSVIQVPAHANTFTPIPNTESSSVTEKVVSVVDAFSNGVQTGSGLGLFTKNDDPSWTMVSSYLPQSTVTVNYVSYTRNEGLSTLTEIDGSPILAYGHSASSTMELFPDSIPVAVFKANGSIIRSPRNDGSYYEDDGQAFSRLEFYSTENQTLTPLSVRVLDEDTQQNINFFDCIDLTNDGLIDLAVYPYSNSGAPIVYVNTGAGVFAKLDDQKLPQTTTNWGSSASSDFFDYNNDGILDLIVGPMNGIQLNHLQQDWILYEGTSHLSMNDYSSAITINDRIESSMIKTWAGDDTIFDLNANPNSTEINAGDGIDTIIYSLSVDNYSATEIGESIIVTPIDPSNGGADTLISIETLQFSDGVAQLTDLIRPEDIDRGIYRFFNVDTGTHFLSGSTVERDSVINNLDSFNFEGPTFRAADPTNAAADTVFRFFNTQTGTHFFTQSTVERDNILDTLPQFSFEGEAYKGYTEQVDGSIPLYRFFNTQTGTHFYTAAEAEKDSIVANLPSFNFEGTAYWVDPVMG